MRDRFELTYDGRRSVTKIEIPFEKTTLPNGLRVVAHHDAKAPIVTVSVWYHVGSKNDVEGKTGLAHLFEHLMFEGSAHHDAEHFEPLERAGASVINGTTNRDRTNYFETVPTGALALALWLESDRMGHLLATMTQKKLDEQRDVVRNEKKQSDNQPYGGVSEILFRSLYPRDHPYSWPIIGRLEDLDRATLEDVSEWFETWYRPNNAVVVVSGDVDVEAAMRSVEAHFGTLAAGPPVERPGRWIARLTEPRRREVEDRVPQARLYRAWNVPPIYDPDYHRLGLVASVLSHGKTSRLFQRLVHDEQIATDVSAHLWGGEIGSSFLVQISCAPDVDPAIVERALDEEIDRVHQEGLKAAEVERARRLALSGFVRGIERSGGFGGKSEILAHGEVFRGDPAAYAESLAAIEAAEPRQLHAAASTWLDDGSLTLQVRPAAIHSASPKDVDRTALPEAPEIVSARLPFPASSHLDNGLEVLVLERRELPVAHFRLVIDAGFAADSGAPRGTASLTMAAIDEGTDSYSSLEISDRLATLGARLFSGAGLDHCRLGLATLGETADEALALLADVAVHPAFPEPEVERLKKEQIARIRRELAAPVQLALRVLPLVLYGEDHPYGMPFTGSGSIEEVESTRRGHLVDFHHRRLGPERSTLICLGDLDTDRTLGQLEEIFGGWAPSAEEKSQRPEVPRAANRRILLLDRPESIQSIIFGGQLAPPRRHPSEIGLEAFHQALGGTFTSRLNLNLREDKGWTYGAHSLLWSARGQRPMLLYSSVQTDATAKAIDEMDGEVRRMLVDAPITPDELDRVRRSLTLSLPARRETLADIATDVEEILSCDLRRDYYDDFAARVEALTPEAVSATAGEWIDPDRFVWVVVGDLTEVRRDIERLGWGDPQQIDARGRSLD